MSDRTESFADSLPSRSTRSKRAKEDFAIGLIGKRPANRPEIPEVSPTGTSKAYVAARVAAELDGRQPASTGPIRPSGGSEGWQIRYSRGPWTGSCTSSRRGDWEFAEAAFTQATKRGSP